MNIFTLWGRFGVGKVKISYFPSLPVFVLLHTLKGDVLLWFEAVQFGDSEFTDLSCGIKYCGEASKDCCMKGDVEIKLLADRGNDVHGVWLSGFPLGCGRGKGGGCFE